VRLQAKRPIGLSRRANLPVTNFANIRRYNFEAVASGSVISEIQVPQLLP
jgi:hypothetical protein